MKPHLSHLASACILLAITIVGLFGCGGPVELGGLTSRELYDQGLKEYNSQKYIRSIDYFQTLVYNYPGESVIDTAQYYLAMSYYGNRDFELAAVEFNRLLVNYPSSVFAAESQLMRAVCYYQGTPRHYGLDQTDLETAIQQFEDFLIDYPESDSRDLARTYLDSAKTRLAHKNYEAGLVYTRIRDFKAAEVYYQVVIDNYTNTSYAPLSAYRIADGYLQRHDWDKAHEKFFNFTVIYPEHELAAKAMKQACEASYKGGKDAYKNGDYAAARTRFERYQLVCGEQDKGRSAEVAAYLSTIPDMPVADTADSVETPDAGS